MKRIYITILVLLLINISGVAGKVDTATPSNVDTAVPSDFDINPDFQLMRMGFLTDSSDVIKNGSKYTMYGDILNDDPEYNKRYSILLPIVDIIALSTILNLMDEYVFKYSWSDVSLNTWRKNLKAGWIWGNGWWWDEDRFGNNFLSHPVTGAAYFNGARSSGYNFWASIPFVVVGAYSWKIFGENGKPERNDVIVTTTGGIYLGEVLYRITSNILDDRMTGFDRTWRETLSFLIDPMRGLNRMIQGKTWRTTTKEIYQKEPLTVGLSAGVRDLNNGISFGTETYNPIINFQLDYGDPFEDRSRKPFDLFKVRAECNFRVDRKIVDNIVGYGIITGTNRKYGNLDVLYGLFFGYDYWDNNEFELQTSSITGGIMTRWNLSDKDNLYTKLHIGIVPFGANSTVITPDTSQYRDYDFVFGIGQAQFESTLNLGNIISFTIADYLYLLHTLNAPEPLNVAKEGEILSNNAQYPANGENLTDIFRPNITVTITGNLRITFEQMVYYTLDTSPDFPTIHRKQTQQRIFLTYKIEDFRKGKKPDNAEKK